MPTTNCFLSFFIGVCFATGTGVPKDEAEAVEVYKLAAYHGHAAAQYNLGEFF